MLTFVVPDSYNAGLYKFMYPFFVSSYLYGTGKLPEVKRFFSGNKVQVLMLTVIVYAGLFSMYGYYAYIYTSGYAVVGLRSHIITEWKFWNDIYRMLIGFIGAAMILLLLRLVYDNSRMILRRAWFLLQNIGIASLAIYIISGYINEYVLQRVCKDFELNYAMTILETIFVVLICYVGFALIRRQRIANRFLLGGR